MPYICYIYSMFENRTFSSLLNGATLKQRCARLACQPTSQQYCSLILNQHQPPATSQSTVLFSHNKSAPAISHSQANTANAFQCNDLAQKECWVPNIIFFLLLTEGVIVLSEKTRKRKMHGALIWQQSERRNATPPVIQLDMSR